MKREFKQGDIWFCNSNEEYELVDSEQKMGRLVIIVSTGSLNINRNNVIIAPITKAIKKHMINHYHLFKKDYNNFTYEDNTILLECIRDISKKRLDRKLCEVSKEDLDEILKLIDYNFKEFTY